MFPGIVGDTIVQSTRRHTSALIPYQRAGSTIVQSTACNTSPFKPALNEDRSVTLAGPQYLGREVIDVIDVLVESPREWRFPVTGIR
jgi:hypothetical protein